MKKEGKFKPKKGKIDFTKIRWAPIINCIVQYKGKILVVERTKDRQFYPNYWNGISGFLDDNQNLKEKVYEELREEVGLLRKNIISIFAGPVFDQEALEYKKTWIVHPVLVKVNTDKIKIDNIEARNYKWIRPEEIKGLKLLPGFDLVFNSLFKK
jgi:isopentenyldiphosphate isomerase